MELGFILSDQSSHFLQAAYYDVVDEIFTPNGSDTAAIEFVTPGESNTKRVITEIPNYIRDDLTQINMNKYNDIVEIRPATTRFNCHSFAWYSQDYESNTIWLEDPRVYYWEYDRSYEEVDVPRVGDIICYINDKNTSSFSKPTR